jgi:hypothetical protein
MRSGCAPHSWCWPLRHVMVPASGRPCVPWWVGGWVGGGQGCNRGHAARSVCYHLNVCCNSLLCVYHADFCRASALRIATRTLRR